MVQFICLARIEDLMLIKILCLKFDSHIAWSTVNICWGNKLGGRLHDSISITIEAANFTKSNHFNFAFSSSFLTTTKNDESCTRLFLQTDVRWFRKSYCLRRNVTLQDSILLILRAKRLRKQVIFAKCDKFYQSDIFEKLNLLTYILQRGQ